MDTAVAIPTIVAGIGLIAGLLWLRRTLPSRLNRTVLQTRAHRAAQTLETRPLRFTTNGDVETVRARLLGALAMADRRPAVLAKWCAVPGREAATTLVFGARLGGDHLVLDVDLDRWGPAVAGELILLSAHRRHGMIVFGSVLDALYTAVVEAVRAADPVARIDDPRPGRAEDLAP